MAEAEKDPAKLKEHLAKIKVASDRMDSLIEFTKTYQDLGNEPPGWYRVADMFDEAMNQLKSRGHHRNVSVGDLKIFSDRLVERVFYNLLDNSVRHGVTYPRIKLEFQEAGMRRHPYLLGRRGRHSRYRPVEDIREGVREEHRIGPVSHPGDTGDNRHDDHGERQRRPRGPVRDPDPHEHVPGQGLDSPSGGLENDPTIGRPPKKDIYSPTYLRRNRAIGQESEMEKRVHVKLDRNSDFTLREVLKKIEEIQAEHPELDVFFDGDDYAICSRPRKVPEKQ